MGSLLGLCVAVGVGAPAIYFTVGLLATGAFVLLAIPMGLLLIITALGIERYYSPESIANNQCAVN